MAAFNLAPISLTTKAETSGFQTNPDLDKALGSDPASSSSYTPPPPATKPATPEISAEAKERERLLNEKALRASETVARGREELADLDVPEAPTLDKAPTRRRTDPMEAFGSTASVLAMIGSAFTKRPMLNALNSAAGVMEAFKANDTARAKEEFDIWKANSDAAITQFNMQNTAYKGALDKLSTNSKLALDEVQVLAAQWGDPIMKELARTGALSQAVQHQQTIEKSVAELTETNVELEAMYQRENLVQELVASPEYAAMTPNQKAAKINEIRNPSKALGEGQGKIYNSGNYVTTDGRRGPGFQKADGVTYWTNPTSGEVEIAPPGTIRASISEGGPLSADALVKRKLELNDDMQGAALLKKYFTTMKDVPSGIERWATDLSARGKTLFGQPLNEEEEKLGYSQAMIRRLVGLNRESVVGGGVMTAQDAEHVLVALGGDPASAFQNPQILAQVLKDMYEVKLRRIAILQEEVSRSDKFRRGVETPKTPGAVPPASTVPTTPVAPAATKPPPESIPLPANLKDALEGEIIINPKTKERRFKRGNELILLPETTGPAGGPAGTPMAPIEDSTAAKGRTSAIQPQPKPTAAAPTGRQTPQQRMAAIQPDAAERSRRIDDLINMAARDAAGPIQGDPTAFLSHKPTAPFVQRAEPTGTPIATPQTPSQRLIEVGRRNAQLPADSDYSDIEYRRRAATKKMDEALGRPRAGTEPKKKPRSYQIKRAADGSTIVTVLE